MSIKSIYITYIALFFLLLVSPINATAERYTPHHATITLIKHIPPSRHKTKALRQIILDHTQKGELNKAFDLLKIVDETDPDPVYASMMSETLLLLGEGLSPQKVLSFTEKLTPVFVKDFVLEQLALGYINSHQIEASLLAMTPIQSPLVVARLQSRLVQYYSSISNFNNALRTLLSINSDFERDNATLIAITALSKNAYFLESIELLGRFSDTDKKADAQHLIAIHYAQNDRFKSAFNIANEIPINALYQKTLERFVSIYAQKGIFDKAFQLAESIQSPEHQDRALMAIAIALAHKNQYNALQDILLQIKSSEIKTETIQDASFAFSKISQFDDAMTLALTLSGDTQKSHISKLATQFGQSKDFHYAQLVLDRINDPELKEMAYIQFTIANANQLSHQRLQILLNGFKTKAAFSTVLDAIVDILSQNHDTQNAIKFAKRAASSEDKSRLFMIIAEHIPSRDMSLLQKEIQNTFTVLPKKSPFFPHLYRIQAQIYFSQNKPKKAVKALRNAMGRIKTVKVDREKIRKTLFNLSLKTQNVRLSLDILKTFKTQADTLTGIAQLPDIIDPSPKTQEKLLNAIIKRAKKKI